MASYHTFGLETAIEFLEKKDSVGKATKSGLGVGSGLGLGLTSYPIPNPSLVNGPLVQFLLNPLLGN